MAASIVIDMWFTLFVENGDGYDMIELGTSLGTAIRAYLMFISANEHRVWKVDLMFSFTEAMDARHFSTYTHKVLMSWDQDYGAEPRLNLDRLHLLRGVMAKRGPLPVEWEDQYAR